VSSFALAIQFIVVRPSKRQAARSLQRYLRARSRAACLPHALTREKGSSLGVAPAIDRSKTEWHKLSASKAIRPGRHHLGTPGNIMSERWARSSRNAWATSSESALHTTAAALAAAPVTYSLRSDDLDFLVLCFARPEDAEAFAARFGGRRLPMTKR
jgi:hypothetical protein